MIESTVSADLLKDMGRQAQGAESDLPKPALIAALDILDGTTKALSDRITRLEERLLAICNRPQDCPQEEKEEVPDPGKSIAARVSLINTRNQEALNAIQVILDTLEI